MENGTGRFIKIISCVTCNMIAVMLFSSCALPRRTPVVINSISQDLPRYSNGIIVYFEESIPGKPLHETVWDSARGAFWDVKESGQIGFTQNYKAPMLIVPPVLMPVAAKSGVPLVDTLIVIPFGKIFTGVFESALQKSSPKYTMCFDNDCARKHRDEYSTYAMKIKITDFFVWEGPLNNINFYVKGYCLPMDANAPGVMQYVFEEKILNYELGGVLSTHSRFMDEMNKVSNQLAEKITLNIFSNGLVTK